MQSAARLRNVVLVIAVLICGCKSSDRAPNGSDDSVVKADTAVAPALPAAPEPPSATGSINGFRIAGFEYWPFRWSDGDQTCPYPYPTAVRYGFDAGSDAARRCMREVYRTLWTILQKPPEALARWRDQGGPTTVHLWINDYSAAKVDAAGEPVAACAPDASMRHIWHYNPPAGLIKWVGEVYKDGTCRVPTAADLQSFIASSQAR